MSLPYYIPDDTATRVGSEISDSNVELFMLLIFFSIIVNRYDFYHFPHLLPDAFLPL